MGRNDVGEFYTRGQRKCQHCGDYFPENWIGSHETNCPKNPANKTEDDG